MMCWTQRITYVSINRDSEGHIGTKSKCLSFVKNNLRELGGSRNHTLIIDRVLDETYRVFWIMTKDNFILLYGGRICSCLHSNKIWRQRN